MSPLHLWLDLYWCLLSICDWTCTDVSSPSVTGLVLMSPLHLWLDLHWCLLSICVADVCLGHWLWTRKCLCRDIPASLWNTIWVSCGWSEHMQWVDSVCTLTYLTLSLSHTAHAHTQDTCSLMHPECVRTYIHMCPSLQLMLQLWQMQSWKELEWVEVCIVTDVGGICMVLPLLHMLCVCGVCVHACACACVYPEYICSEVCTARCQWSGGVRPIYGAPPGWAGIPVSGVSVCLSVCVSLWQTSMRRCWLNVVAELSLWLLLFSYQVHSSQQLWLQCTLDQGSTCTKWVGALHPQHCCITDVNKSGSSFTASVSLSELPFPPCILACCCLSLRPVRAGDGAGLWEDSSQHSQWQVKGNSSLHQRKRGSTV